MVAGCGGRGASGARGIAGRDEPRERFSRATRRMTLLAYGEAVWSWRPLLASSLRRRCRSNRADKAVNSQTTVTRRIRRRGERGVSRKAIAQGMSECFRSPVCSCAPNAQFLAHETAGAACTRHSLRPLVLKRDKRIWKARAKRAARMRNHAKPSLRRAKRRSNPWSDESRDGLLRGACHRARIRATRWLAMTAVAI